MNELEMVMATWGAVFTAAALVGIVGTRWFHHHEDHVLALQVERALTAGAVTEEPDEAAGR